VEELAVVIGEYGFPIVMMVGLGYFIYFIWNFIGEHIDPALEEMHMALIKVIDKTRMLDQDMIRLQQKVNVVLEYREKEKIIKSTKQEQMIDKLKSASPSKAVKNSNKKGDDK
jgi:hypothetical protein